MKSILKVFGVIFGLIVVALAGVVIYAATLDPNDYKGYIADKFRAETGRSLELDGEIGLRFSDLVTSIVGFVIKIDLAKTGGILFMLLCGWMLAWFFSFFFFPNSNFNWTLNFIGIALFVGMTAWDTAALKVMAQQMDDHPARGGVHRADRHRLSDREPRPGRPGLATPRRQGP